MGQGGGAETVFENLRSEPHVLYLLPEYEDPASQQEVLEESWPVLFEAMMLEGWARDEALWPEEWTLGMFQEWLEIQMCSIVQNLDSVERLEFYLTWES